MDSRLAVMLKRECEKCGGFIYVATPYSKNPQGLDAAYQQSLAVTTELMQNGIRAFSPIVHSHPLAMNRARDARDHDFWMQLDLSILQHSAGLLFVMFDGWANSDGMAAESERASDLNIPEWCVYPHRIVGDGYSEACVTSDTSQEATPDPKASASSGKVPMHLLPPAFLAETSKALNHGATTKGYGEYNWRGLKLKLSRYIAATMRHITQISHGQDIDPESGLSHWSHIGATSAIMLDAIHHGCVKDDRPLTPNKSDPLFTKP